MAGKAEKEINVEEHILVPKHSLASESETNELLEKFNITKKQLPAIKSDDPAVEKLNPKVGDIIKIIRDSPVHGKSVFYRAVVD